jgi:hypothetical protein
VFCTHSWSAFFGFTAAWPKYQPRFQMRLSPVTLRQLTPELSER